jgi:hypothetical protein
MNARRLILATLCTVMGVLVLSSAPALAGQAHLFSTGLGGSDRALATPAQPANGHVFDGSFGAEGPGTTSFGGFPSNGGNPIQSIAVDESTGDVYVYSASNGAQVFKSNSSGEPVDFSSTEANNISVGGFGGGENEVAVDNSSGPDKGDFYVANGGEFGEGVKVYESDGSEVDELNSGVESVGAPWGEVCGVAVDPEGDVYLAFNTFPEEGVVVNHVNKYTPAGPAGTPLGNSDYTSSLSHTGISKACDIAVDSKGDVYLDTYPQGPVVEYRASQFGEAQAMGATIDERGQTIAVEPAGKGELYVDEGSDVAQYGATGGLLGKFAGSGPGAVKSSLGVAVNALTREVYVADEEEADEAKVNIFSPVPPGPPSVEQAVVDISSTSATLQAQIDPNARETHYYFQYGTVDCASSPSSCTDVPSQPGQDVGSGEFDHAVSIHLQDLLAGTTYHFRVVASNALDEITEGPDQTFVTQPGGGELTLPDNRAWELVSPANKNGSLIEPHAAGGVIQASENGTAIAYVAEGPVGTDPPTNNNNASFLSARGSEGWSTLDIATPHDVPVGPIIGHGEEYRFFSEDLSLAAVEPLGELSLSPETTEHTVYLRHAGNSEYQPLVTAANVPKGTEFGGQEEAAYGDIALVTGTPDLSHVILGSSVPLTSNTTEGGYFEWGGGQLQLVTILPNGTPASSSGNGTQTAFGAGGDDVRHAISNDGSHVVWSAQGQAAPSAGKHLYLRDMTKGETVQVDADQGGLTRESEEGAEPLFQTANSEGSKVFFTDTAPLTADSTAPGGYGGLPDLYVFEVTSGGGEALAGKLTDLTAAEHAGEHADVEGVLPGASEDGSYVYVVAKGVLADAANAQNEKALPGKHNLYLLHDTGTGWTTTFVATLSRDDGPDWIGEKGAFSGDLAYLTARVSPDGRYFAFMSDRSLTGYDNTDANSGQPDEEVFLYDARSGQLRCTSCNPSGARPAGTFEPAEAFRVLVDPNDVWSSHWLAGSIPGWTAVDLGEALYQSRYLSDSGRLFFDSPDVLVPQATNGRENVYEYEPEGIGSCQNATGCVGLISSGTSGEESAFLDASANGDDVFFVTASKLAFQDYDSAFDVYDAHVCGASAPCFEAPVAPPPCTTADSCKPAPSPQPAIFGAPASGTFSGAGNVVQSPSVLSVPSTKALTRAQQLSKALKACKGKHRKKARALCETRARKLYGPKSRTKRSTKRGKKGKK